MPGLGDSARPGRQAGDRQVPHDGGEAAERQRAADAELVALLARHNFAGPLYEEFERQLCEYGRPVLLAWLRTGEIFAQCGRRNLGFGTQPRRFTSDDRAQLANATLAAALPAFRQRSLIGGGWRPAGKASLTTYFVNSLPMHFSNAYRSWCREVRKEIAWQRRISSGSDSEDIPDTATASDPQQLYLIKETVQEELSRLKATTRSILVLMDQGYTYKEIAEIYGMTDRAVEGVVSRHRKNMRRRSENEFG